MPYTFYKPRVLATRVGQASYNFVVTGTSGTVTPADAASGVFLPTSIALSTGVPSGNFTYTPTKLGDVTITLTNNIVDPNPSPFTYTGTAADRVIVNDFVSGAPTSTYTFPGIGDSAFHITRNKTLTIGGITYQGEADKYVKN